MIILGYAFVLCFIEFTCSTIVESYKKHKEEVSLSTKKEMSVSEVLIGMKKGN